MLALKKVKKNFNKNTATEKIAIDIESLNIEKGEVVTVVGGNGSGKTTLLNLIAGSYIADEGQIFIDGVEVTGIPEHKRAKYIGRVFQNPLLGTAPSMTIEENLAMAQLRGNRRGLAWGVSRKQRQQYRHLLSTLGLGLEYRLKDPVHLLSGGERQALTILMATLSTPKLLLLDEHTASLDPKTASIVMELTEKIVCKTSLTTIMVTHSMHEAIAYGNRIIMLHEGRIKLDLSGKEKNVLTVEELVTNFGVRLANNTMFAPVPTTLAYKDCLNREVDDA